MREVVTISFEGSITLPVEELDAVMGDVVQAVQNALGHAGIAVVSAAADHVDEDEDLSWDALAEERWADEEGSW